MNFLVDAQLPFASCAWLSVKRHDAVHVGSLHMVGASDATIADHAEAERLVVVSEDENSVAFRLPDRFAFVWLRCGNATDKALSARLRPRWNEVEALLIAGERFVEVR